MIYPYLYYCNIVWGSTYKTNLHRLVILQTRVVRIISKSNFDAPSDPIFKEFHILKFDDIHFVELGKFMYSYKNSLLPGKFKNAFLLNNQTHSYNTRIADAFNLPFCRTNARQFSVCCQGPKYFNPLDKDICNSVSLFSFKSIPKQYIYSNYTSSVIFIFDLVCYFFSIFYSSFPVYSSHANCNCIIPSHSLQALCVVSL